MSLISSIRTFNDLEISLSTAKGEVSCWGSRMVRLTLKNENGQEVEKQVSLHAVLDCAESLSQKKDISISSQEVNSGKRIVTHLMDKLLLDCKNSINNNCFKKIVVAIRDFFVCFFKSLQNKLTKINKTLEHCSGLRNSQQGQVTNSTDKPVRTLTKAEIPRSSRPAPFAEMRDLFSKKIKTFLSPSSYVALCNLNRSMKRHIQGVEHLSFDHVRLKLAYNIRIENFVKTTITIPERGRVPQDFIINQGKLIYTSKNQLVQIDIATSETKTITTIPKEVFTPPRATDLPIEASTIRRINSEYFYLTNNYQTSVWHFNSLKAVYAFPVLPYGTSRHMINFFEKKQCLVVTSKEDQGILNVFIKQLNDLNVKPIEYRIIFPGRILNYQSTETGIACIYRAMNGEIAINLYPWQKPNPQLTVQCEAGYQFHTDEFYDNNPYYYGEKFVFFQQKGELSQLKKVEIATGNVSLVSNIEGTKKLFFGVAKTHNELLAVPHLTQVFIINMNTGSLLHTINIKKFCNMLFSDSGNLVLFNDNQVVSIYDPLTGQQLSSTALPDHTKPGSIHTSQSQELLFVQRPVALHPNEPIVAIDLAPPRILGKKKTDRTMHAFEEGRLVSINSYSMFDGKLEIDDYNHVDYKNNKQQQGQPAILPPSDQ